MYVCSGCLGSMPEPDQLDWLRMIAYLRLWSLSFCFIRFLDFHRYQIPLIGAVNSFQLASINATQNIAYSVGGAVAGEAEKNSVDRNRTHD